MRALILAAGYGKRLGKITKSKPKCLIKYNKDNTMLDMWIKKLINCGIYDILINTHYRSEEVKRHIKKNYSQIPSIKTTFEKKLLGTGITIFKNKKYFKDVESIVLHADNYAPNFNFKRLINYHKKRPKNAQITMLTFKTNDHQNSGIIKTNSKKMLTKFYEKNKIKYGFFANGAIYIFTKRCLKNFFKPKFNNFFLDICDQYKNLIYVYNYKGTFIDIGSVKNYNKILKYQNTLRNI